MNKMVKKVTERKYARYDVRKIYTTGSITGFSHNANVENYKEMLDVYKRAKMNSSNLVKSIQFIGITEKGETKVVYESKISKMITKSRDSSRAIGNAKKIAKVVKHVNNIENDIKPKETQQNDISLMNITEFVGNFSRALEKEMNKTNLALSKVDKEQDVILHRIEVLDQIEEVDNSIKLKLINQLTKIRTKRRVVKKHLIEMQFLMGRQHNFKDINSNLSKLENNLKVSRVNAINKYKKQVSTM